jgi:hypothetical protein
MSDWPSAVTKSLVLFGYKKSFSYKNNVVRTAKRTLKLYGWKASNKEVDSDDLVDFAMEAKTYTANVIELYYWRTSFILYKKGLDYT